MIGLLFFIIILALLLILSFVFSKKNIMTPPIFFLVGFFASALYAVFYVNKMELEFSIDTIIVLVFGTILFTVPSCFLMWFFENKSIRVYNYESITRDVKPISLDKWKLFVFSGVEALALLFYFRFIMRLAGTSSISVAMRYFDTTKKFTNQKIDIPSLVTLFGLATTAMTAIQIYLLCHQLVFKYHSGRIFLIANVVMGVLYSLLSGGRNGAIEYVLLFVILMYFLYKRKYNWNKKISFKVIFCLFLLGIMMVLFLFFSAELMGRGKQSSVGEYLCVYLSAELKNLDIFMRKGIFGTDFAHSQTLINLREYLSSNFGMNVGSKLDLPFQNVNGFSLGNVYTIFYMFMYDGGYVALIGYTLLMVLIAYAIYYIVIKDKFDGYNRINIPLIVYGYICVALLFSFFSDKFYEKIFFIGFIRQIIVMIILEWFLLSYRYKRYFSMNYTMKFRFTEYPVKFSFLKKYY